MNSDKINLFVLFNFCKNFIGKISSVYGLIHSFIFDWNYESMENNRKGITITIENRSLTHFNFPNRKYQTFHTLTKLHFENKNIKNDKWICFKWNAIRKSGISQCYAFIYVLYVLI